jgi:hypothetical protein
MASTSSLVIASPPKTNDSSLQTGDYIGVFDSLDNCYGLARWDGTGKASIALMGKATETSVLGFKNGDKIKFKVWISSEDCIIENVSQISADKELVYSNSINNTINSLQFEKTTITYKASEYCINENPISPEINYQPKSLMFTSDSKGLSIDSNSGSIQTSKCQPGTYSITFKTNKICLTQKTATLTINDIPRFEPTPDTLICGEPITVAAPAGYDNINWSTGERSTSIKISEPGTSWFTVTNSKGCNNTDTFTVKKTSLDIFNYQTISADCYNKGKLQITNQVISNGRTPYTYRLKNMIDNSEVSDITNIPEGIYSATIINSNGCELKYYEKIKFEKDCLNDIPVFTPNDDGLDDTYFISLEGNIKIFDRNGKLKRSLTGPVYFDGKDNNEKPLPMGSYLVVAENGKTITLTIVR